jgi:hypothetical protein
MKIYIVVQYFKDEFGEETQFDLFKDKANAIAFFNDAVETFKHNNTDIDECDIDLHDTFFYCYNPSTFENTDIYIKEENTHD